MDPLLSIVCPILKTTDTYIIHVSRLLTANKAGHIRHKYVIFTGIIK